MAKILVACDEYIYSYNGDFYAASQEKYDLFQRYLRVFEEMRLVVRCIPENEFKDGRVRFDDKRIEIVDLPVFHGPNEYLSKYREVGRRLKHITDGCDAAVLRIPSTIALRVAKKVIKAKIPYVTEVVFDAYDGMKGTRSFIEKMLWFKIDLDTRNVCYQADGVSCVTEYYLQRRYYSKKEHHFTSHYSSLALNASFFSCPRKFPENKKMVIAHVSNQIQYNGRKGHIEVIKALSILKSKGIYLDVIFAGKDYFNGVAKLKDLAEKMGVIEQISFPGYVSRSQLEILLERADLYVMPTTAEGLPRVLIEAMAKGLPCVSSDVSGNPELIDSRFLCHYMDVNSLVLIIKDLVQTKDLYEQVSIDNFNNSLKYRDDILQTRRDSFYSNLKSLVVSKNNRC